MLTTVAAVDLGASSGRVMVGRVSATELSVRPVARFANNPVRTIDGLHWNVLTLYGSVLDGLRTAARDEPGLSSIGIDSWAVDYALLSGNRMLGNPYHYRDDRNALAVEDVHNVVTPAELYQRNGLQFLPFNTLYQLAAEDRVGGLTGADSLLLVPDLLGYWLTGEKRAERTNASTTGLVDVRSGEWDNELITRLGLPRGLFPPLIDAGAPIGALLPAVARELGFDSSSRTGLGARPIQVTAVGSHDTASAIVAVPATDPDFAYISCGTWSLVGVELENAVVTEAGRLANFTNEGGVDGRIRYLHNVMGLWLLSESIRAWERHGEKIDLEGVLAGAAEVTDPSPAFDADDQRFLPPGDLPTRIADWYTEHNLPAPAGIVRTVRAILDSLAEAYATTIEAAARLSGKTISTIHIIGGGSQNALLCQLTADRTGRTVLAGPAEATAIGNVLVQARAQGVVPGSLESLRALVAREFPPTRYDPRRRP